MYFIFETYLISKSEDFLKIKAIPRKIFFDKITKMLVLPSMIIGSFRI